MRSELLSPDAFPCHAEGLWSRKWGKVFRLQATEKRRANGVLDSRQPVREDGDAGGPRVIELLRRVSRIVPNSRLPTPTSTRCTTSRYSSTSRRRVSLSTRSPLP
jgi:hypothetical protein